METKKLSSEINNHYKPLRGYALKLTQNADDANDLVQETMLKALTNNEKFAEGSNLSGWLYTIMRNIFINQYRRMVKSSIFTDDTDNQYYINSARNTSRNEGEAKLIMQDITKAVDKLSENLKTPFLMSYHGYKYEEIAQQLHIPLGTVKIRIHIARQRLKKSLSVYGTKFGYNAF